MLNNKKIFIYKLCFGLSKLYTNIQQDQKAKLDYHMSMLFAYMASGKGGGGLGVRGFKMFCQRGSDFFLLALRVCSGGGGVRFSTSPSVKKITDPLLLITDWSL